MPKDAQKVMSGPGRLYVAAYGTSFPAETGATLSWVSPWIDVGYTKGGAEISTPSTDWFEVEVDQETMPISHEIIKQSGSLKCALAQSDVDMLKLAIPNAVKTTVTAATGQVGKSILKVGSGTPHVVYSVGFESKAPGSPVGSVYWRMYKLYRCISMGVLSLPYRKGETTVLNVEFMAEADSTRPIDDNIISWVDMTAPAV